MISQLLYAHIAFLSSRFALGAGGPSRPELRVPPPLTAEGKPVPPPQEKSFVQKYWVYMLIGLVGLRECFFYFSFRPCGTSFLACSLLKQVIKPPTKCASIDPTIQALRFNTISPHFDKLSALNRLLFIAL